MEKAAEFLRMILGPKPLPAMEVYRQAREYGFSQTTVWQAGDSLNVSKIKMPIPLGWFWSLPVSPVQNASGEAPTP